MPTRASTTVERPAHSANERPGWAGYVAAIVVSLLGHVGFLAFALLVLPNWLHSATVEPPSMTVKIVDNIPAGDLGTHLPKLHNEPEQVAKAEVKPEEPPPPEEKPPPPPPEQPKPDDKNAVSLNSPAIAPTPTPLPPPAVVPATAEPTPTETPRKVAEPMPTQTPPPAKPQHHEKVLVHNPPKARHTPILMAKAESTPDVHEQFRKLQQEMLKRRIEAARKAEAAEDSDDNDDDSDTPAPASAKNDSGERGPVASNANSAGSGYGVGAGTGSMGKLEDLQYLLYFRAVQQRVKDAWTFPGGSNDLSADVEFSIGADGTLNGVKIAKSSGDSAFDESVLRAIRRAAPFPPPPDRYRSQFSDVVSTFKLGELKS
jgi:TonB family protein